VQSPNSVSHSVLSPETAGTNNAGLFQQNELGLAGVEIGELRAIDLIVPAGRICCLSGPSGSGKTRLFRAIADLDPHAGTVRVGQIDQQGIPAHLWRRKIGLIPADSQWWSDRVLDHFPAGYRLEAFREHLTALGLSEQASAWNVSRLSSGERQRLALLRMLALKPQVLLLDEPTANLDAKSARKVQAFVRRRVEEEQLGCLWISHDPDQIEQIADYHFALYPLAGGGYSVRPESVEAADQETQES